METLILFVIIIALLWLAHMNYKTKVSKREKLIDTYQFPAMISEKIIAKYPHLTQKDSAIVLDGLREYFHICNISGNSRMVSMPSQVVEAETIAVA